MQVLLRICHSPILTCLTRLLAQERKIAPLLGPLSLVALLFGLGIGHWLSVSCFQSPRMDLLVGYWLVVEQGVVPGTMGLGYLSQAIVGPLGSAPQAGRVDPLLTSSLEGFSWLGGSLVSSAAG